MKTYLEPIDVALMEQVANCQRDRLLIRLLFRLGCRVSELLSLRISDIDFQHATITILHLKTRTRLTCSQCKAKLGRRHRFCPSCGHEIDEVMKQKQDQRRVRTLPIDKHTLIMLEDYMSANDRVNGNPITTLFNLNRHRAWQIVRDCAKRAELSKLVNPETGRVRGISPHRLRDSFSVHAMKIDNSGDGLRLLQEHLGHANFNTTAKYRKIAGEEHREWYKRLWAEDD